MNSRTFTASTGTPTERAARGSPPAEKIQLPNRVLASTKAEPAPSTRHQTMIIGRPVTVGLPLGSFPSTPISASQLNTPRPAWPPNRAASQSVSLASRIPPTMVEPLSDARQRRSWRHAG